MQSTTLAARYTPYLYDLGLKGLISLPSICERSQTQSAGQLVGGPHAQNSEQHHQVRTQRPPACAAFLFLLLSVVNSKKAGRKKSGKKARSRELTDNRGGGPRARRETELDFSSRPALLLVLYFLAPKTKVWFLVSGKRNIFL